jgi:hypothetical protein
MLLIRFLKSGLNYLRDNTNNFYALTLLIQLSIISDAFSRFLVFFTDFSWSSRTFEMKPHKNLKFEHSYHFSYRKPQTPAIHGLL